MRLSPALKLLCKLALLVAPFAILFILNAKNIQSPENAQQGMLQDKIERLVVSAPNSPQVIIAGESRAEKSVLPIQFTSETGLEAVNVAVGFGSLSQMYDAFSAAGILNKQRLIAISVSSYEINDTATGNQFAKKPAINIQSLSVESIAALYGYYAYQLTYFSGNLKNFIRKNAADLSRMDPETLQNKGYLKGGGFFTVPEEGFRDSKNPWYVNVKTGGNQEKEFLRGINGFGHTNDTVVIYIGPIAPSWRKALVGTDGPATEAHFREVVRQAIAPYPTMHFIDFSSQDIAGLGDEQFSDEVHLNTLGGPIFTHVLVNALREEKLIK